MKVVVGGGSGYIGRALVEALRSDGHDAIVVSRRAAGSGTISWDTVGAEIDGADAVVNLAGVSIGSLRWTKSRKEAILRSRVDTTQRLVQEISMARRPPRVLVTASGIGWAGDSGDVVVDETSPPGMSFLAQVGVAWEAAAADCPVRHVALRTAFVVGPGAPALRLTALPYRFFLGGPAGGGRQWFPWIQLEDVVRLYRLAIDDDSLEGPVDAVAPEQLRQREAARSFGKVLHRPALVPTPAFALRAILGEQADLILHGQRAVSRRLDGFEFRYRGLQAALEDALD